MTALIETTKTTNNLYDNTLIYGKSKEEGIVALEVVNNKIVKYYKDGSSKEEKMIYWTLAPKKLDRFYEKMEGSQHYCWIKRYLNQNKWEKDKRRYTKSNIDHFTVSNKKELAMIYQGITQFKGLQVKDVSVLSFDIEASGLVRDETSNVFLITNTFRSIDGQIIKKHFRVDEYDDNDGYMIDEWCKWVNEVDPTIITGHNIYGYDLPYLIHCYKRAIDEMLPLGRNNNKISVSEYPSNFRVDGNTGWEYNRVQIPGRHIVDGMFLAVKYDIGRKYPSWGLKAIAEYEGFVKPERQFYDASKINENWSNPVEREKIVAYGIDDSDDSLAIYDLMIPSFFYMTQSVPKPFQIMCTSASGAQLNAVMTRAYLQENHSIPKSNERQSVSGGMSYGIPGVYRNVSKWDAKSYYPSTILAYNISDPSKDPKGYFTEMVKHFTYARFEQKDMYKETKDKYYDDMQAASKVFINSAYGLLGTNGLNFNCFENASKITKYCRSALQKAVIWATSKDIDYWWEEYKEGTTAEQDLLDFEMVDSKAKLSVDAMPKHDWKLVNLDTDSLSFCKSDETPFTKEENEQIYEQINNIMYSEWEPDGEFDSVVVLKAKNYCLLEKGSDKIKKKGSSITDTKKEPALLEMLDRLISDLIYHGGDNVQSIYISYIKEAIDIQDISRWATKKTVSKAILNPTRTNEQKVLDAIGNKHVQEGDKLYFYSAISGEVQDSKKGELVYYRDGSPKMIPNKILKLTEKVSNDIDVEHYVKRVYSTISILKNVIDMDALTKYHLKSNIHLVKDL